MQSKLDWRYLMLLDACKEEGPVNERFRLPKLCLFCFTSTYVAISIEKARKYQAGRKPHGPRVEMYQPPP